MEINNDIPNNEMEILIVEDSPTQALNLQYLLEKNNYKVSAARNGREALDFVKKKKPTLIISDIVMPEMDGFELCRNIKTDESLKDIPILILSALSDPEDIIKGLSNGADNFLTKPYEEKLLLSRIEYVLVNRNMRKNLSSDLGIEIYFAGKKYFINSDRLQILDLLFSTYDNTIQRSRELERKNKELEEMQEELKEFNAKLEQKVVERTQKIRQLNSIILAVRNVNQLISREKNLTRLIQGACDNLISTKSFSSAWIILKDKSGKLTGASDSGSSKTFIRRLKQLKAGEIPACFEKVLSDEEVVCLKDGQSNCENCAFGPICADKVLISVRLEHGNNTYGLLTVALEEEVIPEKEGIGLLKEVGGDIAFALNSIELEEKRKHLQEKVNESEKRYRALFENMLDGFAYCRMIFDDQGGPLDFVYLSVNSAFERLTGLKNVVGKQVTEVIPRIRESNPELFEIYGRVATTGKPERFEIDFKPLAIWLSIAVYGAGKGYFVAVFDNITERKRAEEALEHSEKMLRAIFEGARDGILGMDAQSRRFVVANETICRMLGYSRDEIMKLGADDIHPPEDLSRVMGLIERQIRGEIALSPDLPVKRKDGSIFYADVNATPIELSGRPCLIGIFRDITERRLLDEKLKESEAAFRELYDDAPVGYHELNNEGIMVRVNQTEAKLLGYSVEELIGRSFLEIVAQQERERARGTLRAKLSGTMKLKPMERKYVRKDGTVLDVLIDDRLIVDGQGRITGIRTTLQDISELKKAEEQIKQLAKFPAENPDPVLRADKEGRIIYANKSSEPLLNTWGCAESDLLPLEIRRLCLEALKTGMNQTAEPKCAERDFLFLFAPIIESGYVNLYGREITKLRQAEEGRRLLETAIEQAAEYILITDTEGAIQYVNPAFEKITGFKREEAIGGNPRILKSGLQDEAFYRDLWETIKGGRTWQGHITNKKKDGTLYTEEAAISPVRNPAGQIVNFVAVKRDVTQELNLENQLRHAQKMESIGQLAGGVAHDFNNILTTIMGYSSSMKKAPELSEKIRKRVEEIEKASQRGAELTKQLLTFSRKQTPRLETINLNEVINGSLGFLKRTLPPTITIESKLSPDLGLVNADSGQMQQILMNLCVNSRDAMPGGGKIRIETENIQINAEYIQNHFYAKPGPFVLLTFTDTGEGIKKELLSRIFEPFFTTKSVGKGTGLGLSIVYGIVKTHGGFINVYSEEGKGTTFKIYLPQTTGRVKAKSEAEPVIKGGNETVLIVEDEDMILNLVFSLLGELGYKCYTAANGLEGLKVYQEKGSEIDLVILDIVMPKMNGPELFVEIRKINPEAKVIMSSGFSLENEDDLLAQGVKVFIPKPYQIKVLARAVREVLDRKT
ncbi:MAG: PAS domain S-box protein [Candidatus Glassbacteria bacterium]